MLNSMGEQRHERMEPGPRSLGWKTGVVGIHRLSGKGLGLWLRKEVNCVRIRPIPDSLTSKTRPENPQAHIQLLVEMLRLPINLGVET